MEKRRKYNNYINLRDTEFKSNVIRENGGLDDKKKNFKRLDYIRIIALIMVFLYHLKIVKGGFLAVCTFFTLTGYLGCMSALKDPKFSIKAYYINRLKRIYIPLIIVVSSTIIIDKILSINWVNLKPETTSVILGYNNFWQLHANLDYFTRHVNSPFMHLWYISILMQFELVFPITFLIVKKLDKIINKNISIIIVFFLTITSTAFFYHMSKTQDIMLVYYNTIARSFSIFWGICLALIQYYYDNRFSRKLKKYNKLIFMSYSLILIILCLYTTSEKENYAIFMIITTIITTRLIKYSTIKKKIIEKPTKIVNLLARSSYEIYLVQYPIIFFMQNVAINNDLKSFVIIGLTLIISCFLHLVINKKLKNKSKQAMKIIIFAIIIVIGSITIITEKDHSAEMQELEDKLNENLRIIEEKNKDLMNLANIETVEVQSTEVTENNKEIDETQKAEQISKLKIVGVGDSVLLGSVDALYAKFPNGYFDGKVSRTIKGAEDVLTDLINRGILGDIVVLNLANNGDYSDARNKELMELLGNRKIYWMNAVGADDPQFNSRFKEFASNYSNIHIVEWDVISKNHPEYFYADGIHLKGDGAVAYANAIYEAIYNDYYLK